MRSITISVDEETCRLTRIRAAKSGTSMSALVRGFLKSLVQDDAGGSDGGGRAEETELERRRRLLNEVFADFDARGVGLRMTDNLPREALYDRDASS